MATNRLRLDFSINDTEGRRNFVEKYVCEP
jgi:hypothetical protein